MSMEGGEAKGGGHWEERQLPQLPDERDRVHAGVSNIFFFFLLFFINDLIRAGRQVCRPCAVAKQRCAMSEGETIKVVWKKMDDREEGSSRGKKQKRKDEEEIEVEFELWRRVERRWEESEWRQEQRWAVMWAVVERIADDVQELDGLVPEKKGKEMEEMEVEGTEKDGEGDMEVEEMLKETEKSADEAERVERDVMEE